MLHCSNTATCELFCFVFFSVLVLCRSISFLFYWVEICVRVVWLIIYLTLFYVNDLSYQGTVCRRWTYFDICDLMSLSKFYVYIWVQFPFPSTYLSLTLRWRTALVKKKSDLSRAPERKVSMQNRAKKQLHWISAEIIAFYIKDICKMCVETVWRKNIFPFLTVSWKVNKDITHKIQFSPVIWGIFIGQKRAFSGRIMNISSAPHSVL